MMELTVSGMTCGGCAKAVEKAVVRKDADARVSVDLANGRVSVDSSLSRQDVADAIEAAGYEVAA